MCKTKTDLVPSVWGRTDYVAFRFDYFSIGGAKDEIAGEIQTHFPGSKFASHKLRDEDRMVVSIDSMAYNLNLSLDEVNNETVYHFLCQEEKEHFYEIYVGRYFTQVIYRKKAITDSYMPNYEDIVYLLDYILRTEKLNLERMTCTVHTIVEDTWEVLLQVAEPVVLSELHDNNVSQSTYTDTRELGDIKLESKRAVNRSQEEQYKLEVTGVSYYLQLTADRFLQSYVPLMNIALLENTRYFVS